MIMNNCIQRGRISMLSLFAIMLCAQVFGIEPFASYPWGDKPGEFGKYVSEGEEQKYGTGSIVIDDDNNIYANDVENLLIQKFDNNGVYVKSYTLPGNEYPEALRLSRKVAGYNMYYSQGFYASDTNYNIWHITDNGIEKMSNGDIVENSASFRISPQGYILTAAWKQIGTWIEGGDGSYKGLLPMKDVCFDHSGIAYGIEKADYSPAPASITNLSISSSGILAGERKTNSVKLTIPTFSRYSLRLIDVQENLPGMKPGERNFFIHRNDMDADKKIISRVFQYSDAGVLLKQLNLDELEAGDIATTQLYNRIAITKDGEVIVAIANKDGQKFYRLPMEDVKQDTIQK